MTYNKTKMNNKRIALITGANKGIGLETARQLGNEGMTVLVGARDEKKSKGAAEKLRKEGIDAHGLVIDVDNSESIQKAVASVEHEHGRLDILINNADSGFAHLRLPCAGLQRFQGGGKRLYGAVGLRA
jgi:NAD(P)-dependent dehydrogenase (short-subunit alcohol dehydrogenase family)